MLPAHDEKLLDTLTHLFQKHGYEGTNLVRISKATGLAKASLYHRFPGGKEEMAQTVLARAEGWLHEHALTPLQGPGSAAERLQAMGKKLETFYRGGRRSCLLDALSFGGGESPFVVRAGAAMEDWIGAIEVLLVEEGLPPRLARLRAEDAVIRIQGALVVARATTDTGPFLRVLDALPDTLLVAEPVN